MSEMRDAGSAAEDARLTVAVTPQCSSGVLVSRERPTAPDPEVTAFLVALGDELRQARVRRGWSRDEFVAQLGVGISRHTLATYELGTRTMSLARLFELCRALGIEPHGMLDRAYRRVFGTDTSAHVDLARLARATAERLRPLRGWARLRLRDTPPSRGTEVVFSAVGLDSMAGLCGLTRAGLMQAMALDGIARGGTDPPNPRDLVAAISIGLPVRDVHSPRNRRTP